MFITKKRLIAEAVLLYNDNDAVSPDVDEKMFYYCLGNKSTLSEFCARLGINLTEEVRKDRERRYRNGK